MNDLTSPTLLHERSRPDFRETYGALSSRARILEVAVRRIRLLGLTLHPRELRQVERIRVIIQEISPLAAASEAEQIAVDPVRRPTLHHWVELLSSGRLEIRLAPLAGWNPDFTVFHFPPTAPPVVVLGPHWFVRPYPHPGPALNAVLRGEAARLASVRFGELWRGGHALEDAVLRILGGAVKTPIPASPDMEREEEPDDGTGNREGGLRSHPAGSLLPEASRG